MTRPRFETAVSRYECVVVVLQLHHTAWKFEL